MTKRVVVTGGNRGIGKAIVEAILSQEEDSMVYLGSRSATRGEEARAELVEANPGWADRLEVLIIDVSDGDSVAQAADQVAANHEAGRPLYGVVNNAGISGDGRSLEEVLEVNTYGPKRVFDAFSPLLRTEDNEQAGRVVNIASASGPNFVADCQEEVQALLTDEAVTEGAVEEFLDRCREAVEEAGDFESTGIGNGSIYGLSKACLNAYTIAWAREHSQWVINACTPGFIETDMTRPWAESRGVAPEEMGMKPVEEGTRSTMHLLFGEPGGSGWYFGSDAVRSPMDRYRSPGDPPYTGD